ncbi:hypothetical protein CHELA40_10913 [Chelatococcus asaccharovorans]|nr:hypothetical protein CHELA40_10913 [Chelatococcus asaccharovorans]CAH1685797.1 hypothetical protein CHELA17_64686 [Chelatococcus asaccharovorans]
MVRASLSFADLLQSTTCEQIHRPELQRLIQPKPVQPKPDLFREAVGRCGACAFALAHYARGEQMAGRR